MILSTGLLIYLFLLRWVSILVLSKKLIAQIEQKYDIKLSDRQAGFMYSMFGRYIRPDWKMADFEWGLHLALKLFPAPSQPFSPGCPQYDQLLLDDGSSHM